MTKFLTLITLGLTLAGCHAAPKAAEDTRKIQLDIKLLLVHKDLRNDFLNEEQPKFEHDEFYEIHDIVAGVLTRSPGVGSLGALRSQIVFSNGGFGTKIFKLSPWKNHYPPEATNQVMLMHARAAADTGGEIDVSMLIEFAEVEADQGVEHLSQTSQGSLNTLFNTRQGFAHDPIRIRWKTNSRQWGALLLFNDDLKQLHGFGDFKERMGFLLMVRPRLLEDSGASLNPTPQSGSAQ